MKLFNENWERWCRISIIKHFVAGVTVDELTKYFIEGFERATDSEPHYVEIRIDGPYIKEHLKNQWRLYFEVNILCVAQEDYEDAYMINRLTGRVGSLFNDNIHVRRYGTGPEDDLGEVGCLMLVPRAAEKVQTSYFGKIRPDTRIIQASVEGHYQIFLD